jgi:acetyltransferase-like isoleucine patch superfamily enzyme
MSTPKRSINSKIRSFLVSPFPEKINALELAFYRLKGILYYRRVFGSFGSGSVLYKPMMLSNPRFMHIGKNVVIRKGARLEAIVSVLDNPPELCIGDNVNIEQNVHIVCHSRIIVGNEVSITGHCAIVDVTHPYQDVHSPLKIGDRILAERSFVEIGDGSFLGFGTTILPNVRVGSNCVIGAHSLVIRDVPDYSVASGNPVKVRRRYNAARGEWVQEVD